MTATWALKQALIAIVYEVQTMHSNWKENKGFCWLVKNTSQSLERELSDSWVRTLQVVSKIVNELLFWINENIGKQCQSKIVNEIIDKQNQITQVVNILATLAWQKLKVWTVQIDVHIAETLSKWTSS